MLSMLLIRIHMDLHHFGKPNLNPHQSKTSKAAEAYNGPMIMAQEPWRLIPEPWRLTKEPGKVCRPVVADSHHFDEEPDPDQTKKPDADPHQSERQDPKPHKRDMDAQH
jgi:hypothetical protein